LEQATPRSNGGPRAEVDPRARDALQELKARIGKAVLGQEHLVESMLIGLLADGNLLIESLPGLAKTRAVKSLAKNLAAELSRIQFTPDLLPSDITGAEIYLQTEKGGQFQFQRGPIFANLYGARDSEPDRTGRHLSASRSPARPLPDARGHQLSKRSDGSRDHTTQS
jgi:MoxR-like ATPase